MDSSLGHKVTNETYYNSFGIFTTSCIKKSKSVPVEFVVCFNRLFMPALTGFHQLFDIRCDETDLGVI